MDIGLFYSLIAVSNPAVTTRSLRFPELSHTGLWLREKHTRR
jgi:hypothetical protein